MMNPHLQAFFRNSLVNYHPSNRQRVSTKVSLETFRQHDFVGAVNYMYRAKTGRDGISYSHCYDYSLNRVEDPLDYAKNFRDQILRLRRDVPFWKVAVSPEFGYMVDDLLPRVVDAFRAYMRRLGHDAILLAVEHNDTPFRHVHLLVPEIYRGWDRNRNRAFISYHITQYRFTKTLPIRLGVNLINVIGRRPDLPTIKYVVHDLRWTPIDDRIRYRMSQDRTINMSHRLRDFRSVYDQIEHAEEVSRLRALVRAGFAISLDKKVLFELLPKYDRLLYSLERPYSRKIVFSNIRNVRLTLDDIKSRGYRIDTRLLPPPIGHDRYEFEKFHSTSFYTRTSYPRLELNRDLEYQKIIGLSQIIYDRPTTSYMPSNGVLLADTRTGFLRLVHLRDIDPDKGHLLAKNYLERQQELGLEMKGGNINIKGLLEKQMDDDMRLKLDMEADFLRRWRLFMDNREEKLEVYLRRAQAKLEEKRIKARELEKEPVLTPEKAVEREISLDFVNERIPKIKQKQQEQDLADDMGLHLGDDF